MSTSCGWCSRAGYDECFCGYERPQEQIIEDLREEVARLKEQLQPYLDAEEEERKRQAWQHRLNYLVSICCPSYDRRWLEDNKKELPIRHPATASWWNGASIKGSCVQQNGDVHVNVRSYIGGGEDEEDEIILFKEWFELDDPKSAVQAWCKAETERLAEQRKEYARKDLAQKITSLTNQLERLQ